jgi:hypothetical protein
VTCADTSSVVAYIQGEQGSDVDLVDRALADCSLVLAPGLAALCCHSWFCRIEIRHECWYDYGMAKERMKKLTILVPQDLLRRAERATKKGATPTVRKGLELLAAHDVYDHLLALEGKVKFGLTWQEMRGEE